MVILKEELCELFDKLRNHNQGSKLNDDMDTNRSLRAQISLFLEEVKASLNSIALRLGIMEVDFFSH